MAPLTARVGEGDPLPPEDRASAADGDPLEQLYRQQGPRLLRFFKRAGGREAAEDLVQRAFLRLAGRSNDQLATLRSPNAYLHRVTTNLARDDARMEARRSHLHVAEFGGAVAGPDPVERLEARDMLRRIDTALGGLRPLTRDIFLAHRIDGYTYAEIAERTGLTIKQVEKQMSKAIARLDRTLNDR